MGFFLKNKINYIIIIFSLFFIYIIINLFNYFFFIQNFNNLNNSYFISKINYFGYSLLFTGILVGFFVFWLADSRIFFNKFLYILSFLFFFILIWFFINEKSYINLFFIYELFLLPSFFLIYFISPNRRSIPVSIYFLTWTQTGSLLVLVAIIYIYINTKSFYLTYNNSLNHYYIFLLLFFGFGIKVPLWPFYYWLTKTHVEASSFFSIYLSGFLVKTAVYLFNHFYSFFYNTFSVNFLYVIILIGIIDSSIKMWHQIDLKKLVAYTTVQEMNILLIPILWNTEFSIMLTAFFTVTHCLLSSLFFFIIDTITKRYNTRITTQLSGILHTTPILGSFIFISLILFSGLPFTAKFYIEIVIFNLFKNYDLNSFIIVFFVCNWFGLIGLSKNFYNILFGAPIKFNIVYDLSKKEIFIFLFIFINLFIIIYSTKYFF